MAVVPVFVSSTFRDFHAERDALVGRVLPRLDELVAPYGCRVDLIDLRWGVDTSALGDEERHQRVLDVCLDVIDSCRPLFLALVGGRVGWQPDPVRLDAAMGARGLATAIDGLSVTGLECAWALAGGSGSLPLALVRAIDGPTPDGWEDGDRAPLDRLVASFDEGSRARYTVRSDGSRIVDLGSFEATVVAHLGPRVVAVAQQLTGTPVDEYLAGVRLFRTAHSGGFVDHDGTAARALDALRAGRSVCLLGPSGAGKSATWNAVLSALEGEGRPVVAHVVGLPSAEDAHDEVAARLVERAGGVVPTMPELATAERIAVRGLRSIAAPPDQVGGEQLLAALRHALWADPRGPVLGIDGLDRLRDGPARRRLDVLRWAIQSAPFLVTSSDPADADRLAALGVEVVPLAPVRPEGVAGFGRAVAATGHRELPQAVATALGGEARTPLWLRMAVHELTLVDGDALGAADGDPVEALVPLAAGLDGTVEQLVDRMLTRAGEALGPRTAALLLALVAWSSSGVRPADLARAAEADDLAVATFGRIAAAVLQRPAGGGRMDLTNAVVRRIGRSRTAALEGEARRRLTATLRARGGRDEGDQREQIAHLLHTGDDAAHLRDLLAWRTNGPTANPAGEVVVGAIVEQRARASRQAMDAIAAAVAADRSGVGRRARAVVRGDAHAVRGFFASLSQAVVEPLSDDEATELMALFDDGPDRRPASRRLTSRRRLDLDQEVAHAESLVEAGRVQEARDHLEAVARQCYARAEGTRWTGRAYDVITAFEAIAELERRHGTAEDQRDALLLALEGAEHLVDLPGVLPTLTTARILIALGEAEVDPAASRIHHAQALERVRAALARWDDEAGARQGIVVIQHGPASAEYHELASDEATLRAELEVLARAALAGTCSAAFGMGDVAGGEAAAWDLVAVCDAARRARPLDESEASDRCVAMDRTGSKAVAAGAHAAAGALYEQFGLDQRVVGDAGWGAFAWSMVDAMADEVGDLDRSRTASGEVVTLVATVRDRIEARRLGPILDSLAVRALRSGADLDAIDPEVARLVTEAMVAVDDVRPAVVALQARERAAVDEGRTVVTRIRAAAAALQVRLVLAADRPSPNGRGMVGNAHRRLGIALARAGGPAALAHLRRAVAVHREVTDEEPDRDVRWEELAASVRALDELEAGRTPTIGTLGEGSSEVRP